MLTTTAHLQIRRPSPTTADFTVTTCPQATLSLRLLLGIVFVLRVLLALSVLLLLHSTWTLSPFHRPDAATAGTAIISSTAPLLSTSSSSSSSSPHAYGGSHGGSGGVGAADRSTNNTSSGHTVVAAREEEEEEEKEENKKKEEEGLVVVVATAPRPTTLFTTEWGPYLLQEIYQSPVGHTITNLATTVPPSVLFPLCLALLYLTTLRIHTTESLLVLRGLGIQTASTGGSYLASWRAGTRFIPTEKIRDVLINEAFRGFAVRYYLVVVVDGEEDVVVVFPRLLPGRAIVERVWRGCRGCLWEPQERLAVGSGGRKVEEKAGFG